MTHVKIKLFVIGLKKAYGGFVDSVTKMCLYNQNHNIRIYHSAENHKYNNFQNFEPIIKLVTINYIYIGK